MQEHINSCSNEFEDSEALAAARELQMLIDAELDSLGPLVAGRPRPYSVIREALVTGASARSIRYDSSAAVSAPTSRG